MTTQLFLCRFCMSFRPYHLAYFRLLILLRNKNIIIQYLLSTYMTALVAHVCVCVFFLFRHLPPPFLLLDRITTSYTAIEVTAMGVVHFRLWLIGHIRTSYIHCFSEIIMIMMMIKMMMMIQCRHNIISKSYQFLCRYRPIYRNN